jgi:hypothetical protein
MCTHKDVTQSHTSCKNQTTDAGDSAAPLVVVDATVLDGAHSAEELLDVLVSHLVVQVGDEAAAATIAAAAAIAAAWCQSFCKPCCI